MNFSNVTILILTLLSLGAFGNVQAFVADDINTDRNLIPTPPQRRRLLTEDIYVNITKYALESHVYVAPKGSLTEKSAAAATPKVAFGANGTTGMFPFLVYLESSEYICGGTVIGKSTVMTAAHCVFMDGKYVKVNLHFNGS